MPTTFNLAASPITAHSFNGDRSAVAISTNSSEIAIFTKQGTQYKQTDTLTDHDKLVTSIDWAPQTNRIVTCSQDRNAYVWNYDGSRWVPTLVLLRLNRSATSVRWSPSEAKFAVASGARTIAVCQFDEESNWWIAKHLKKPLRSTVLSVAWHPNSVLLAAGSADGTARVFSAFMKGVDAKPAPTVWGERLPFGTVCGEFAAPYGGWVHDVAFSPDGNLLAYVSHDATVSVVYPAGPELPPQAILTVSLSALPALTLSFVSETAIIAAGYDCQPYHLVADSTGWHVDGSLDDQKSTGAGAAVRTGRLAQSEAFNRFRAADSRGAQFANDDDDDNPRPAVKTSAKELSTVHQNTITSIRAYAQNATGITQVSTTGVDGKLVIWDVDSVAALTAGVKRL